MILYGNGNTLDVVRSEMIGGRGMMKPCTGSTVLVK